MGVARHLHVSSPTSSAMDVLSCPRAHFFSFAWKRPSSESVRLNKLTSFSSLGLSTWGHVSRLGASISPRCLLRAGYRHGDHGVAVLAARTCVASLGFSADPRMSVERVALRLLKDAASLLVYGNALKGPQGQAFLRLLLLLSRGDDSLRILEAYGEFYRTMQDGARHASWQDCLLEAILTVEDCPYVTAAAQAVSPNSPIPPHLVAAAAADLSTLQRLAVAESTIVGWVTATATDLPATWRAAAEAEREWDSSQKAQGLNPASQESESDIPQDYATRQAEHAQRWREALGGSWSWGEAPQALLQPFHWHHGSGAAALHSLLSWQEQDARLAPISTLLPLCPLVLGTPVKHRNREYTFPCQEAAALVLLQELQGHAILEAQNLKQSRKPRRILVYGPPGMGKTHVLLSVVRQSLAWAGARSPTEGKRRLENGALVDPGQSQGGLGRDQHGEDQSDAQGAPPEAVPLPMCSSPLRFVEIRKESLKSIASVLRVCASMPQLRFVLLLDDLSFKSGDEVLQKLQSLDGDSVSCAWPANVMVLATSTTWDAVRPAAAATPTAASRSEDAEKVFGAPRGAAGLGSWFSRTVRLKDFERDETLEAVDRVALQLEVDSKGQRGLVEKLKEKIQDNNLRATVFDTINAVERTLHE